MIGGLPSSGLGIKTSTWHTFTQVLHPAQKPGLKVTGELAVAMLGKALILFCVIVVILFSFMNSRVIPIVSFMIGFHVAPIEQRQVAGFDFTVFHFDGYIFVPCRRIHFGIIDSMEVNLKKMRFRVETGSLISAGDNFGGGFFSKYEIPGRVAFDIGHGGKVTVKRQRPLRIVGIKLA